MKKNKLLDELNEGRAFINNQTTVVVDIITENVIKTVKLVNSNGIRYHLYEVPFFLVGHPLYEITKVSINVNKNIKKLGLKSVYLKPNKLYVSW